MKQYLVCALQSSSVRDSVDSEVENYCLPTRFHRIHNFLCVLHYSIFAILLNSQVKTTTQTFSRRLQRNRATDDDTKSAPADLDTVEPAEETEDGQADVADSRHILSEIGRQQSIQTTGLVHWIKIWFTMSDPDIAEHCGDDALQYLRFQRYIIAYLAIVVVACIVVILPINFQGIVQVQTSKGKTCSAIFNTFYTLGH